MSAAAELDPEMVEHVRRAEQRALQHQLFELLEGEIELAERVARNREEQIRMHRLATLTTRLRESWKVSA